MPPLAEPKRGWVTCVLLGWLLPGAGYFLLGRRLRGALVAGAVVIMYALGLLMRGALFEPQTGDLLVMIIYIGGFIGNLASGILYLLTFWMGYAQPDVAGHVHDYGTKFLVGAGLLNILALTDVYEIARGKKD